jgi:hypothetical protein
VVDRTDNFNRADGGLGANWTAFTDTFMTATLAIASNVVTQSSNGTDAFSLWTADTFQNDQYSQCVIASATGSSNSGPIVRGTTGGTNKHYEFDAGPGATSAIYLYDAGVGWTSLATGVAVANGDTLRLEITGTTLTAKVNAATNCTATDATLSSGNPGMHNFPDTGQTITLDDWLGGPITAAGAAPFSQNDWPSPTGAPFPPSLRTWAWSYNPNLVGKDVLPAGRQSFELPPRAYPPPGKTWAWSYNINLIGLDALPAGRRNPVYDEVQPILWRREWTQNLLLTTLAPVQAVLPFRQQDWPLPGRAAQPDRTWVSSAATLQLMLPPPGDGWTDLPPPPLFWRNTWTQNLVLTTLVAQDVLPPGVARYDRPPPVDWRRDWSLNLVLTTLAPPPATPPLNQYDWPLPGRAAQPDRTWVSSAATLQLMLPPPGDGWTDLPPPPQFWRNTWTQNLVLTTLVAQDALPPGVARYDRPPPVDWRRDWSQNLVLSTLVGQDAFPPGAARYDRPQPVAWSRDWSQNLLLSTLAPPPAPMPFNQYDWPLPARALQPDRTYIQTQNPPFVEVPPAFGYVPGAADSYFYDWWRRQRRAIERIVERLEEVEPEVAAEAAPAVRAAIRKLKPATLAKIDSATTPHELIEVAARLDRVERSMVEALMRAADEAERIEEEEAIKAIVLSLGLL